MKWCCCTTWSAQLLPPFDGPLLLDTVGFKRPLLAAVLAELHDRRTGLPILALVGPNDLAAQRLSLLCSAVYAVAAMTIPPADLRLWFRSVGLLGLERLASVQPACLGFFLAPLPIHDPDLLRILAEFPHAATIRSRPRRRSTRFFKRRAIRLLALLHLQGIGWPRSRPTPRSSTRRTPQRDCLRRCAGPQAPPMAGSSIAPQGEVPHVSP